MFSLSCDGRIKDEEKKEQRGNSEVIGWFDWCNSWRTRVDQSH